MARAAFQFLFKLFGTFRLFGTLNDFFKVFSLSLGLFNVAFVQWSVAY
jgi:hypothetical protein